MVEYLIDMIERLTTRGDALLIYLVVINVVTFIMYGIDKWKAKESMWRIPEATLLGMAIIGGSIGAWLGMRVWHHKTLHKKFRYGIPLILIVQIALFFLCACGTSSVSQRSTERTKQNSIEAISDKVWAYSQGHLDGFTLDTRTMSEPKEDTEQSFAKSTQHGGASCATKRWLYRRVV